MSEACVSKQIHVVSKGITVRPIESFVHNGSLVFILGLNAEDSREVEGNGSICRVVSAMAYQLLVTRVGCVCNIMEMARRESMLLNSLSISGSRYETD